MLKYLQNIRKPDTLDNFGIEIEEDEYIRELAMRTIRDTLFQALFGNDIPSTSKPTETTKSNSTRSLTDTDFPHFMTEMFNYNDHHHTPSARQGVNSSGIQGWCVHAKVVVKNRAHCSHVWGYVGSKDSGGEERKMADYQQSIKKARVRVSTSATSRL